MMSALIRLFQFFMQTVYNILKLLPTKHKIVMISRQSDEVNDDFRLLEAELKDRYEIVMLCRTLDGGAKASIWLKIGYFFHMFTQMYHMATSKVVILDTYCILVSLLKHSQKLQVIQIWHSIGTMKKFGYSAIGNKEGSSSSLAKAMHMHEHYTYVFCSSFAYRDHLAKGFHCSSAIIREFPLPRIDLLTNPKQQAITKQQILEAYPSLLEKKNILYCPTFRKGDDHSQEHVEELLRYLPDGYQLIVKLHPLSRVKIHHEHLFVCEEFTTSQLFSVADVVISDYSCVVYEAALLDIPLYFYAYDLDAYEITRGLAIDYRKEMPGPIHTDAKSIMETILSGVYDKEKLKQFRQKYIKDTKTAAKDIAEFINEIVGETYE